MAMEIIRKKTREVGGRCGIQRHLSEGAHGTSTDTIRKKEQQADDTLRQAAGLRESASVKGINGRNTFW